MTRRLALCLGLTRVNPAAYGGWDGDCPGCDRDAARFAALCHDAGFDGVQVFINEMADHAFIKPAFLASIKTLSAGDLLVLYNSGHGGQVRDRDGDEADGRDETLCWWSGEVTDDVIGSYLCKIPRGVRVLSVADTCNSGSNFRGRRTGNARAKRRLPVRIGQTAASSFRGSLLHFGGCSDGLSSYGSDRGGEFTLALLDAKARARRPITYREWFVRAADRMPRNQTPAIDVWGGPDFANMEALT